MPNYRHARREAHAALMAAHSLLEEVTDPRQVDILAHRLLAALQWLKALEEHH